MAALAPLADAAFVAARREGRRETPEAYAFDALVVLAGGDGGGAPGYEVMVRVNHSALVRGYALAAETCEIAGFGPVSAQVVADIMGAEGSFYKAIVTTGKEVVGVAHLGRRPNAHQRSALDWLYPTCAVAGCGVRSRHCQTDHRTDWATSHVTVLELLDRLCKFHHDQKTYGGWALVEGKGKRACVAPEGPATPAMGRRRPRPGQRQGRAQNHQARHAGRLHRPAQHRRPAHHDRPRRSRRHLALRCTRHRVRAQDKHRGR